MFSRFLPARKNIPSEARVSIRESLRIFCLIEKRLELRSKENAGCALETPFEDLVAEQADFSPLLESRRKPNGAWLPERSCGRTSRSFAALFFSNQQMRQNSIILHTNGSDLDQLYQNWNCVLYGWKRRNPQISSLLFGETEANEEESKLWGSIARRAFSAKITEIMRNRAESKVEALSKLLLREDPKEILPRVIFCNITWVLLQRKSNTKKDYDREEPSKQVKDHQWTIIKHANNRFQIVQGYLADIIEPSHSLNPSNNCVNKSSGGYCLSTWQNQRKTARGKDDVEIIKCQHGTRYASRHGFELTEMEAFLGCISTFASSLRFDAGSYQSIFGIFHGHSAGRRVWPAVSFRELGDDGIEGYGDRFVANRIEQQLIRDKPM